MAKAKVKAKARARTSRRAAAPSPQSVVAMVRQHQAQIVDFKFVDFPGTWQHFSIPAAALSADMFHEGLGFDGSSIRGWQSIHESDMLVMPDPATAFMDPFTEVPTLSLICNIVDPITQQDYGRDPRGVARRAQAYLQASGLADTAYFGPEAEFYIFDDIRFDQNSHQGYYFIDSKEGRWNSGTAEDPNLGYKPDYKGGYFPVPPHDTLQDVRSEMILTMIDCGVEVEVHHHEVGTAGQGEIDIKYCPPGHLRRPHDALQVYRQERWRGGTTRRPPSCPSPCSRTTAPGCTPTRVCGSAAGRCLPGRATPGLSEAALHYIGGLLRHAPSILAFTNPTTNSYRRLVPGYEAPVNLAYSQRNRSAAVRIPMYSASPAAKRVVFRCPDPSCNLYLGMTAMLMAGLDGIEQRIDPGEPMDKDIYDLAPEERASVPLTPGTLEEALAALEADHDYLLKGDVFTEEVIQAWIDYKREEEAEAVRLRPHPHEFALYFDI